MVSKKRQILEEGEKRIIPAFKSLQVNSSGRSLLPSVRLSLRLQPLILSFRENTPPRAEEDRLLPAALSSSTFKKVDEDSTRGAPESAPRRVNQEMKTRSIASKG